MARWFLLHTHASAPHVLPDLLTLGKSDGMRGQTHEFVKQQKHTSILAHPWGISVTCLYSLQTLLLSLLLAAQVLKR